MKGKFKINRPILIASIGFIIGIIWGLYINFSIVPFYLFISIIIQILYKNRKFTKIIKLFKKAFIIFLISGIIANIYINIKNREYEKVYNQNTIIKWQALVITDVKESEYSKLYNIKIIDKSNLNGKKFILKLNINSKYNLQFGDLINLEGEYEKPSTATNYKGFDYSKYLKSKNIYGTINAKNLKVVSKNKINFISKQINQIKNNITTKIKSIIKNNEASSLLLGITIGNKDYMEQELIDSFKQSSLAHLLAISGQHISYIILAVSFALKISKVGKKKGKIIAIFVLVVFMLITGFSPSVFRAGISGILILLASLLHRKADIYTNLAISLLISLIFNPYVVYDIGLWLSYGGVTRNCFIL